MTVPLVQSLPSKWKEGGGADVEAHVRTRRHLLMDHRAVENAALAHGAELKPLHLWRKEDG